MRLSENFSLSEYTKSQTASRKNIDNTLGDEHLESAKALFENVAQPIRDYFGPTIITSGYRSPELNEAIGGSSRSQHSKGEAVDLEVPGVSTAAVAEWISNNLDYDQLILEGYESGITNSGWIHVSYKSDGSNRNQNLTADFSTGKAVYSHGLNY